MRPRIVGLIVAFTLLVPLLFLAKYNIQSLRNRQQQLGVREGIFSLPPRINKEERVSATTTTNSYTWFDQLKSIVGLEFEDESGFDSYQPVKQGFLNYQRRYPNAIINSVVSVTVSPLHISKSITEDKLKLNNSNETTISSSQGANNNNKTTQVQYNESSSSNSAAQDQQQQIEENNNSKQVDLLSTYRMNREAITGSRLPFEEDDDESLRNIKCHNSKYDRLIAQKISMNDISRPLITSDGRFDNPFPTWNRQSLIEVAKFLVWEADDSSVPKNKDELDKELPMLKPNLSDLLRPLEQNSEFRATWIGHATLLIQVDGYNILTDPMFSDRASFTQYFGPKRIRQPACDIKSLPPIDIVLISHNHYDHLDTSSVQQLNDRFGRNCRWVVPLGMGEFLSSMSVENYVELDWWQKDCYLVDNNNSPTLSKSTQNNSTNIQARSISTLNPNLNTHQHQNSPISDKTWSQRTHRPELDIYLTPSQHWSRRGINDVNRSLWGSFTIVNKNGSTFFFGGDTAYCSAFKEIGKVFGPFTGAAIPIGAYKPRWFLKTSHVDPGEAVQIHKDLRSMKSIGIHHATFILANEHYKEPINSLKEIMDKLKVSGIVKEPFITLKHGETTQFCKTC